MRFKSLYKVCILGSPAAVVWEVPWIHRVFSLTSWTSSLFVNIFTEEKKRQLETTSCLCSIANYDGLALRSSHFGSRLSVRSCFSVRRFCSREEKVTSWLIFPTARMFSWIWPRLTAAVDGPDSLLPPAIRLCEHRVLATSRIICLMLWLCSTDLWKPVNCAHQPGKLNVGLSGWAQSDRC